MIDKLPAEVLQYAGYAAEFSVLVCLFCRRSWKRDASLGVYALLFLLIDGVSRPYVLYHYGLSSRVYEYYYWGTDVLLTLAAFLLICFFFRRACARNNELWPYLRLMLIGVFALIVLISYFSLIHHYDHLFTRFIVEFQQNLYFACLVLNTVLYVTLQRESADEELSLLVCGLGIEFAGPAAGMALMYLTPGGRGAGILYNIVGPLCNLGMYLIWLFAIVKESQVQSVSPAKQDYAESSGPRRNIATFAEAPARTWGEV